MKIGKYEIYSIETGTIGLDGGAMFGIIPKQLWQKTNPADELNRVTLTTRCLLLKSDNRNILIDTGIGTDWDEKFMQIYRVENSYSPLLGSLSKIGLKREDITDVILTHLHFDHTGGSTYLSNGKMIPTFPNAKYYIQKRHFDWSSNPTERDCGSFIPNRFLPLYEEGILHFTNGEEEFDDEIRFIVINGHTFSQQMVKISDTTHTLLYCGDLIPFSSHIPIPYVMGYDLQPLITVQEKKRILQPASEEDWKLFFEHDPFSVAATVMKTEKGFAVKEKFSELK